MKNHRLIVYLIAAIPSLSFAQGVLENPVAGSTESGIGVISGWHCTASDITASIDGRPLGKAGSGTSRNDTASVCGRADTGYSLLYNYNILAPGSHTISLYADGQLLETRQFNTVQSGGAEFVTGMSKTTTISDFPASGKTATLQWSQSKQSFVVTGISGGGDSAIELASLQGIYSANASVSASGIGCAGFFTGSISPTVALTTSGNTATMWFQGDACVYSLSYVSGNSTSGFNFNGSISCDPSSTSVTGTSIRKIDNQLHGTITEFWPTCTQTISF